VAARAKVEAQIDIPPHLSELNGRSLPAWAILENVPAHLGIKAGCQDKTADKLVAM
jgi:hypothetical protein